VEHAEELKAARLPVPPQGVEKICLSATQGVRPKFFDARTLFGQQKCTRNLTEEERL